MDLTFVCPNCKQELEADASLAGTLSFSIFPGFTIHSGDHFVLMTFSSSSGAFDSLALPTISPDLRWVVDYNQDDVSLSAAPEPSSIALLLSGFGGLFLRRSRRRK